jgi:hypothetical protein
MEKFWDVIAILLTFLIDRFVEKGDDASDEENHRKSAGFDPDFQVPASSIIFKAEITDLALSAIRRDSQRDSGIVSNFYVPPSFLPSPKVPHIYRLSLHSALNLHSVAQNGYVDPVDVDELSERAFGAMLSSLDPYTEFENPVAADQVRLCPPSPHTSLTHQSNSAPVGALRARHPGPVEDGCYGSSTGLIQDW